MSGLFSFSSLSGRRFRAFTTTTVSLKMFREQRKVSQSGFGRWIAPHLSAVGRYDNENIMSPQLVQLLRESESWSQQVTGLRTSVSFISVSPDGESERLSRKPFGAAD
jgi:hypothetical protein